MEPSLERLQVLGDFHGIESGYHDIWGAFHPTSASTYLRMLSALGHQVTTSEDVEQSIEAALNARWEEWCEPAVVEECGSSVEIQLRLPAAQLAQSCLWRLRTEDGLEHHGEWQLCQLERRDSARRGEIEYHQVAAVLPVDLPLGYHALTLAIPGWGESAMRVIVAPSKCIDVVTRPSGRHWGVTAQLYSIRSPAQWGIGDFGDLRRLATEVAQDGGSFVGINPLHALFQAQPATISPYSPNSRHALNDLYLAIDEIPEAQSESVKNALRSADLQFARARLQASEHVDYPAVRRVKHRIYRLCFEELKSLGAKHSRSEAFAKFCAAIEPERRTYALYEALSTWFSNSRSECWGWPVWSEEFRNPESEAVKSFAAEHRDDIDYYLYLQWLCEEQLATIGTPLDLGVYGDLALGANSGGAESWVRPELFAFEASAGAPPDLLNVKGQVWGIPPWKPAVLRKLAYQPFIDLLRFQMTHFDALRIDHILNFLRLFWVPNGLRGDEGAYVRYPLRELLAITALESQRHGCVVIGEDLGTIPDQLRTEMAKKGVLSYKVFMFMKDETGGFLPPDAYPIESFVTFSTHDLPTLEGFLQGRDLEVRKELSLFSEYVTYDAERERRSRELQSLEQALPHGDDLVGRMNAFLRATPALLVSLQYEDLNRFVDQMNLPGTIDEHPNWRLRIRK